MSGRLLGSVCVLFAICGATVHAQKQASHPFSIHDMLAMDRISDPQVSPDDHLVVFVRRATDLDANRGRTDLWLVGTDGQGLRRLTSDPAGDWNPRWAPDGKTIWFLSSRGESTAEASSQVWRIAVDGGEAQQISHVPLDVGALAVSPRGSHVAFSMEVFPDAGSVAETKKRLDKVAEQKASGRIYDRLFIRHWDTWKDGRRAHVFVMPVDGGDAVDVMRGMDADCPTKPFGGPEDFTFTPEGTQIVFAARDVGVAEPWSTDFDLYLSPINGSKKPRCLTESNEAWDAQPLFSPDGSMMAYLAMERAGYESDRFRIVLLSWPTGETRVLTAQWDRSPGAIAWSSDSKTIYAIATNLGQRSLFAIDARSDSPQPRTVLRDGTVTAVAAAGDRILIGMDHLLAPVELYTIKPDGSDFSAVTRINAGKVAAARMGAAEQFTFTGHGGDTVHAYFVKPVDFDESKKYPLAFLIHGGPQGSFGNHFHYRWNPQAYAGAGYAAVMVDFHGSTGYGQAFCDSIRSDWGGKPLEDLQKGLAATLERYPWIDGERVAGLGASFGGFMVNWIAGNWPDRFRCLVNHDGNLCERLAYYDTEELWFPEWDHQGTPWDNPEGFEKHNPINFVKNWKTPMLVIHGALDYRVVDTQGISTFTALQRRGIPSKLLYFPDENHWVLHPANSILWHETVIAWLDRWTK